MGPERSGRRGAQLQNKDARWRHPPCGASSATKAFSRFVAVLRVSDADSLEFTAKLEAKELDNDLEFFVYNFFVSVRLRLS
jgi:hypothetical protein